MPYGVNLSGSAVCCLYFIENGGENMGRFYNSYVIDGDVAFGWTKSGIKYIVDSKNVEWLSRDYTCYAKGTECISARRHADNKEFQLSKLVMSIGKEDSRKVIRNNQSVFDYRECNLWVGNKYDLKDGYYEVTCRNQKKFKIDVEDYDLVSKYVWHVDVNGYVISDRNGNQKSIKQHRLIMGILDRPELEVDHIYHDTCDNRKENLRIVDRSGNMHNVRSRSPHGCPGVELVRGYDDLWKVSITYRGERIYLGCFHSKEDAISAREQFEKQHNILRVG